MADETHDTLSEMRQLLGALNEKRDQLVEEREQIGVQITELEERREALDAAIAEADQILGPQQQKAQQPRSRGVKKAAEDALKALHRGGRVVLHHTQSPLWFPQQAIIDYAISDIDPTLKPHSLVSSFGRLEKEGVIVKRGKRNHHEYALVEEPADEPTQARAEPEPEKGQSTASEPVAPPAEVVMGKLKDAGIDGCTKRDLAWAVGDTVNVDGVLDRLIADNEITSKGVGGEIRYYMAPRVAEPRPLFGGKLDDDEDTSAPAAV